MARKPKHETMARRQQALELRLAGKSYREIAVLTGVSHTIAHEDVKFMVEHYAAEPATQVRDQEVARLDKLVSAHWDAALAGNFKATQIILSIMDRRAKLLGLDAPQKINVESYIVEMALREGLDPQLAVIEAQKIIEAAGIQ